MCNFNFFVFLILSKKIRWYHLKYHNLYYFIPVHIVDTTAWRFQNNTVRHIYIYYYGAWTYNQFSIYLQYRNSVYLNMIITIEIKENRIKANSEENENVPIKYFLVYRIDLLGSILVGLDSISRIGTRALLITFWIIYFLSSIKHYYFKIINLFKERKMFHRLRFEAVRTLYLCTRKINV